jgi:hypothetical protein
MELLPVRAPRQWRTIADVIEWADLERHEAAWIGMTILHSVLVSLEGSDRTDALDAMIAGLREGPMKTADPGDPRAN